VAQKPAIAQRAALPIGGTTTAVSRAAVMESCTKASARVRALSDVALGNTAAPWIGTERHRPELPPADAEQTDASRAQSERCVAHPRTPLSSSSFVVVLLNPHAASLSSMCAGGGAVAAIGGRLA
jgi:hypothetical protein